LTCSDLLPSLSALESPSASAALSAGPSTSSGRALALMMNTQTTYPSFGHEIAQGATTLW
jgi:hypothetical protein